MLLNISSSDNQQNNYDYTNISCRQTEKTNRTLESNAIDSLKHYYLNDERPFCVAFSGGKDSTALLYLVFNMLQNLKQSNIKLTKKVYIINSNTLAELPPLLEHLRKSLHNISKIAKSKRLPLIVKEVVPETKNTLNVQLLGVGMPPPTPTFRWCTDKLKVTPIEQELKNNFPEGKFISIIGTRKDESADRSKRIRNAAISGTSLKLNDRYKNANNLMPIEDWSTKDVWEFLFKQDNTLVNIDFLWKLYSDASGKDAKECLFVGAGGKDIEEGKIGCGISRFGCWQCYMVRDNDKSLDGLLKSNYKNIDLYKDYRDWYWQVTQDGWEKTRDPYSHKHHGQEFYNKGKESNDKIGITMPKGITLRMRKNAFKKILDLQSKLDEIIITTQEIIEIQKRWLLEGDLELTAFKEARKYHFGVSVLDLSAETQQQLKEAKEIYKENLNMQTVKKHFSALTLKRFAIQKVMNPKSIERKFFPAKEEEKHIRKEWILQKKITTSKTFANLFGYLSCK